MWCVRVRVCGVCFLFPSVRPYLFSLAPEALFVTITVCLALLLGRTTAPTLTTTSATQLLFPHILSVGVPRETIGLTRSFLSVVSF